MSSDKLDELLAQLEDELGPPQDVITEGPQTVGTGDQDVDDPANLPVSSLELDAETGNLPVRTKRQAIEWGFDVVRARVAAYAGLCLMFVRQCFGLDAMFPDARAAWEATPIGKRRRCTTAQARRGHPGYFRGGEHWHVVLLLGNGRCLTNDTGEWGTINVAYLDAIEQAWGYEFLGDAEWLNGEDVPAPKPRPQVVGWEFKVKSLTRLYSLARQRGHHSRAARYRRWIEAVKARHDA